MIDIDVWVYFGLSLGISLKEVYKMTPRQLYGLKMAKMRFEGEAVDDRRAILGE